jgi:hypothetical protein
LAAPLHAFHWSDAAATAGFEKDACYLVRPDGHVALASASQDVESLEHYVRRVGLRLTAG